MNTSLHQALQEMEKDLFQGDLSDIIEVTYAYTQMGEYFLNRTLFEDFIWEKFLEDGLFLYQKTQEKLERKIWEVQKYSKIFHNFDPSPEREILLWMLESVRIILEMTQNSLPFEAIKAGFIPDLPLWEISERVAKNEMFETILFDGNIKNSLQESRESLALFLSLFQEKKEKLSSQEQENFLKYFEMVQKKLTETYGEIEIKTYKISQLYSSYDFLEKPVDRAMYKQIFEKVFALYGLSIPIIIEERSSIYDGEMALRFPNSPAYEYLKLGKVLALIQHEIETHYLIARNNQHVLGSFRGAKNLQREEWLAVFMEEVFLGKKIEKFWANGYASEILFGEILDGKDFQVFLQLLAKLKGEKNALWVFLRRKRNYPFSYFWVQHKDASYGRGVKKVIDWIVSGKDISLLYAAKVSFEDIGNILLLQQQKNISPQLPLFIAEMLLFLLMGNNWSREGFLAYFYEKYPFFQGISFLENFSFDQEKSVQEIFTMLKKYIEEEKK